MFVRVVIEFDRHDNATVIPVDSLVKSNGNWGIFIADTETMRAKYIPVTPGIISSTMAEIVMVRRKGTGESLSDQGNPLRTAGSHE